VLVAVFKQWAKIKLFCRPGKSAVVTFVSLNAVHAQGNLRTVCCVQNVPLIEKCSRITRRRGVQWQAIMSRNNENVA